MSSSSEIDGPRPNGDVQQLATSNPEHEKTALSRGLTTRHIQFIALGSAIGTGLFLGSAGAIQMAGPAVLLAYLASGAAVYMVMRALGEMSLRDPLKGGSFSRYAHEHLGSTAGFTMGWLFILEMLVVAMADVTAFATYLGRWFPAVPAWAWIILAISLVTLLNMVHVKVFGETEFWLSTIKVLAVIAMIVAGIFILIFHLGSPTGAPTGVQNLWDHGGFAPNGVMGVLFSLTIVVFAFGGVETLGLASAEAKDPGKAVPRAIKTIPVRILLFYIGAVGVMLCLAPWSDITSETSPFVQIFDLVGLPAAADVLNFIVITAAFSGLNGVTFSIGRMLHGLAELGDAPKRLAHTSGRGTPVAAILMVAVALGVVLVLGLIIPEGVFMMVASIASFATVFVWLLILASHIAMKRRIARGEIEQGPFPVPMWPFASWAAALFIVGVIVLLGIDEPSRPALIVGAVTTALLVVIERLVHHRRASHQG